VRTSQPQLLQRPHPARLQQLPHDAIRLPQVFLQQHHAAPLPPKRHGRRAAQHARAHNHDVRLVVLPPPHLALVARLRAIGRARSVEVRRVPVAVAVAVVIVVVVVAMSPPTTSVFLISSSGASYAYAYPDLLD
jgi:hypothetical protein